MQRGIFKHITIFLILIAFFLIRVVDAHAFSHLANDDDKACELCEFIIASEKLVVLNSFFPCKERTVDTIFHQKHIVGISYKPSSYSISQPLCFYNKPPPLG